MDAIRCQALSRTYGEVEALKPLDLIVPAGSVFGFLGRNGAGKTTTIRLLIGLARPTTGRAWVNGVETTAGDGAAGEQFGYLPQEPAFYNWMTPTEYLAYVGRLFRLETAVRQQRIPELLELVGLDGVAQRRIEGFSGGMKRRLGLAQALIHRPPVLILDEPLAGMDPAGRRDVLELLDSLRGDVTVFFSSHILADVDRVCDTIGIIHEGELLLTAARDELLARYATNAIQLEFARESKPLLDAFLPRIETQPWAGGVTAVNGGLRVAVMDTAVARQALLPLIIEHGLVLNKYEWVRPSLEDVFLAISESASGDPRSWRAGGGSVDAPTRERTRRAPLRDELALLGTAVRKELQQQWRTKRALVVGAVFLLFGLGSPLLAKFTPELLKGIEGAEQFADLIPEPTTADSLTQYIKNLTQFGFILAILLGMGAVAGEKERGTAAMILSKPLPRWAFVLSKFMAQTLVYFLGFILAAAGAIYYTGILFEPFRIGSFLLGNGLLLLWLLTFTAVTLLGSVIGKSTGAAAGFALVGSVILLLVGSLPKVGALAPSGLVAWASQLGLDMAAAANGGAAAAAAALIVVALVTAVALFEVQEV